MTHGNLALLLDETASLFPDRICVTSGETTVSYAAVHEACGRLAQVLLDDGVRPGDRVALTCPNSIWFTIGYFAILKAGAVVVPLSVMLKASDIAHHLDLVGASVHLCADEAPHQSFAAAALEGHRRSSCSRFLVLTDAESPSAPSLRHCRTLGSLGWTDVATTGETHRVAGEDLAALLFTSGTTGEPRAAELTHANLGSNARAGEVLFGADRENPDVYLAALPLSHSFGQSVVQNGAVAHGGTLVLLDQFTARTALDLMERHRVTFFAGVPTMWWELCALVRAERALADKAAGLRMAVSGGAALARTVHHDAQTLLGLTVLEGYGLSETSPVASFSRFGHPPRVGSIGTPLPGVRMRLLEPGTWEPLRSADPEAVGEIAVQGPNVMRGYHDDEEATRAVLRDGWLRTGDLGRRDADGWYYVVDRLSDVIIRGGYNIFPSEVEKVLADHPRIDAVAVRGFPDARLGEEVVAFVVPRPGAEVRATDVVAWARERLPAFKYPRRAVVLDRLPLGPTGKVLRRALSEAVEPTVVAPRRPWSRLDDLRLS